MEARIENSVRKVLAAPGKRNKRYDSQCEDSNMEQNGAQSRMLSRQSAHHRQNGNKYKAKRKIQQKYTSNVKLKVVRATGNSRHR